MSLIPILKWLRYFCRPSFVTQSHAGGARASGGIPPWLGRLHFLEVLDLSATQLGGERFALQTARCDCLVYSRRFDKLGSLPELHDLRLPYWSKKYYFALMRQNNCFGSRACPPYLNVIRTFSFVPKIIILFIPTLCPLV